MGWRILADLVLVVHLAFVLFAAFGATLVWWWGRAWLLHLPAVAWGVWVEWTGAVCPLTPLEYALRARVGGTPDSGDFLERLLVPVLYPAGLTPALQQRLAMALLGWNLLIYGAWWFRSRRKYPIQSR